MKKSASAAGRWAAGIILAAALGSFGSHAALQTTPIPIYFSIDWQGPTTTAADSLTSIPIAESDILQPPVGAPGIGTLANPRLRFTGADLGLAQYSSCDHVPGTPCHIEVDALSLGNDYRFQPAPPPGSGATEALASPREHLWFSVDEHAVALASGTTMPDVAGEALAGDVSADIFVPINLPPGPLPPSAVPLARNVGVLDGNGLPSATGFVYPGIGLEEPNFPSLPPDTGDDLDALHMGPTPSGPIDVYFSLDANFIDPVLQLQNSGSALAQGVTPGAILRKRIGGAPLNVYASAPQLGLDQEGTGTDDLDALILWDNGDGVYQPSIAPYDWLPSLTLVFGVPPRDMAIFSVRRGSAIVGTPDSRFGIPIEPGDLLTPPPAPGVAPGIWIAAENLSLKTKRMFPGMIAGDELDAATSTQSVYFDCNDNGTEDAIDIANGASSDDNKNGIPDECERKRIGWLILKQ
ncbi:MAG: hypothetical protein ACKVWV_15580 [Planctomycetota bacterium]